MKHIQTFIVVLIFFLSSTLALSLPPQTSEDWRLFLGTNQVCPIIFIHGIAAGFEKWDKTASFLSGNQVHTMRFVDDENLTHSYLGNPPSVWVWNVSYYSPYVITESVNGNLTLYAKRLEKIIDQIVQITSANQVILIAHSMGGLVARKYITLSPHNDQRVAALLTVGTPHEGVPFSLPIVGQLQDVMQGSPFLTTLDIAWRPLSKTYTRKWGVIGGVFDQNLTDSGGPGFVHIRSAIPFGEWQLATKQLDIPLRDTPHFGFCCAVIATHNGLLRHPKVFEGIYWAVKAAQDTH